jgi:hypothetical protein
MTFAVRWTKAVAVSEIGNYMLIADEHGEWKVEKWKNWGLEKVVASGKADCLDNAKLEAERAYLAIRGTPTLL